MFGKTKYTQSTYKVKRKSMNAEPIMWHMNRGFLFPYPKHFLF